MDEVDGQVGDDELEKYMASELSWWLTMLVPKHSSPINFVRLQAQICQDDGTCQGELHRDTGRCRTLDLVLSFVPRANARVPVAGPRARS